MTTATLNKISANLEDVLNGDGRSFPPLAFGPTGLERDARFEDYEAVGAVIRKWAMDEKSWPKTCREFLAALGNGTHIVIDEKYTAFTISQVTEHGSGGSPTRQQAMDDNDYSGLHFLLRLPPRQQLTETLGLVTRSGQGYPAPPLYTTFIGDLDKGGEKAVHARVAEYSMRGCR